MKNTFAFLGLLLCIAIIPASFFFHNTFVTVCAVMLGGTGIVAYESSREKRKRTEIQLMREQRSKELIGGPESVCAPLTVTDASNFWLGLGVALIGGFLLCLPVQHVLNLLLGAPILLAGILIFLTAIPRIGQPALEMDRFGFTTPEFGRIHWNEVDAVALRENMYKGRTLNHVIVFKIPGLDRYVGQFSTVHALLYQLRGQKRKKQLCVMLRIASEQPGTVFDIAKEFLRRATGRDHPWFLEVSDEENEAYRRLHYSAKATQESLEDAELAMKNHQHATAAALLHKTLGEKESSSNDYKIIQEARTARNRKNNIILVIFLVLVLAYVIWKVLRIH